MPSSASSSRIACDTEGCDTYSASAARVMPPSSTTARNRRSSSEIHRYSLWSSTSTTSWTCGFAKRTIAGVSLVPVAVAGVGIGFAFGLFGAGGSAFGTPVLVLLGVPAPIAIASPLPAVLPAALVGARQYLRAGVLDRRVAVLAVAAGVPMALARRGGVARRERPVAPDRLGRAAPRRRRPDGRARPVRRATYGVRRPRATGRGLVVGGGGGRGVRHRAARHRRRLPARADLRAGARLHRRARRRARRWWSWPR